MNYKMLYEACGHDFDSGLRKLSDITEEEKKEFQDLTRKWWPTRSDGVTERVIPNKEKAANWAADQTRFYLSKGFDLFGFYQQMNR